MSKKKVHRFLVERLPDTDTFTVSESATVHQIVTVLRLTVGEQCIFFTSGGDDNVCEIVTLSKDALVVKRIETIPAFATSNNRTIIAAIGIPKGDTFELMVQKLTEIGIHSIVPIISSRTVKQSVRLERLQTISDEALEQCGGSTRVTIHEPMTLQSCLDTFKYRSIVFHAEATILGSAKPAETLVYYIGPEGGWSDEDETLFASHKTEEWSLGPRVLRTETAAIIAAYMLC